MAITEVCFLALGLTVVNWSVVLLSCACLWRKLKGGIQTIGELLVGLIKAEGLGVHMRL